MSSNQFFEKKGPFPLKKIITNIGCSDDYSKINDFAIHGVESLSNATKNDMTFLNSSKYKNLSLKTKAAACITTSNLTKFLPGHCIKIDVGIIENSNINLVIKNQKDSFTQVLGLEMTECKSRYR